MLELKTFYQASALEGRRDFREFVGVAQLKALWPVLLTLERKKVLVKPEELYNSVKVVFFLLLKIKTYVK